jgi:hypothetical protein
MSKNRKRQKPEKRGMSKCGKNLEEAKIIFVKRIVAGE